MKEKAFSSLSLKATDRVGVGLSLLTYRQASFHDKIKTIDK
jgi:hypothetical protein